MSPKEIEFYDNLQMDHGDLEKIGQEFLSAAEDRLRADVVYAEKFMQKEVADGNVPEILEDMKANIYGIDTDYVETLVNDIDEQLASFEEKPDTSLEEAADRARPIAWLVSDYQEAIMEDLRNDVEFAAQHDSPLVMASAMEKLETDVGRDNPFRNIRYWDPDHTQSVERADRELSDVRDMMPKSERVQNIASSIKTQKQNLTKDRNQDRDI